MQLAIEGTGIRDLTPLVPLEDLRVLDLAFNAIEDIAPLLDNPGLDDGDCIDLKENPLNARSRNELIPLLRSQRNITIAFESSDPACELLLTGSL
ncbi:MAG: hypothetical protein AAFX40_17580 [Cyanobacteria bacterium J06639_1]